MRGAQAGVVDDSGKDYFVPRMGALDGAGVYSGAWAGSISLNLGAGRSLGGLLSLVQQHDALARAKAAAARVVRIRIMGMRWWFSCKKRTRGTCWCGETRARRVHR